MPIGPDPPPVSDADYADFSANLEDTEAAVREISIDEFRLLGPTHAKGRWFFKPDRTMQLGPVTLDVRGGEFRVGEKSVLTELLVHLEFDRRGRRFPRRPRPQSAANLRARRD